MATSNEPRGAAAATTFPTSEGVHKESLLDDALAETFPASDPISPAYEARLAADREPTSDDADDEQRVLRIGSSVAAGLLSVAAAAALWWLLRSKARRPVDL